jgi:hypothetical protein
MADSGHVRIVNASLVEIDKIGYGASVSDPEGGSPGGPKPSASSSDTIYSIERKATATSGPTTMGPGGSQQSWGNGWDTDVNRDDWFKTTYRRNPQNRASPPEAPPPPSNDWNIDLDVTASTYYDTLSYFGVDPLAIDGYDSQDGPETPFPPSYYVALYFPHPEWGSPFGANFNSDVRAPLTPGTSKTWSLEVSSYLSGPTTITVSWPLYSIQRPDSLLFTFIDVDGGGTEYNMATTASFIYTLSTGIRHFQIRVTSPSYVPDIDLVPTSYEITLAQGSSTNQNLKVRNLGAGSLTYNLTDTAPWLSEAPTSGTVPAHDSTNVTVTFNAAALGLGNYADSIVVTSNDPDEPTLIVPCLLHVVAGPIAKVLIEDQPGGAGTEVGDVGLTADEVLTVYAVGRDAYDNFVSNVSVSWTGTGVCAGLLSPTTGTSTTFTAGPTGTGTIASDDGLGHTDLTGTITVSHGVAVSIHVTPDDVTLTADDTQDYTATASDADANTWDVTSLTTFTEDDPVGSFAGNVYSAGQVGDWTVTGTYGALTDDALVHVTHGVAVSLVIAPDDASLVSGGTQAYTATATDADANTWDATSGTTFTENDPTGYFTADVYTAGTIGDWTVTGTYGSVSDDAAVHVTDHGTAVSLVISPDEVTLTADDTQAYTAVATDAGSNSWDVTGSTAFSTTDPCGLFAGNVYQACQVGDWTVTGMYLALTDDAIVHVTHGAAVSLHITPDEASLSSGGTLAYTAMASDADANSWDVTGSTAFSTTDPTGYFVNNVYHAGSVGDWTNTGTYAVLTDDALVHVTGHGPAVSIQITPDEVTLTADGTQAYTATATDAGSNTWDVTSETVFSTTDPCGSFVGNVYSACQVGDWTVTGTYLALTDDALVHVTHGVAVSLVIAPDDASLISGGTQAYTATATDADANSWDATSGTIFTENDPTGYFTADVYTAGTIGDWTVTGTYGSVSDDAVVHVTDHGVAVSLVISPDEVTLTADDTQAYTAVATDAGSNSWDVTGSTAFSTTDPCGGFAGNVYSACQVGDWTVTGTYLALTDDALVHVTHGVAVSLDVTPDDVTLTADDTQDYAATAADADANTWDVTGSTGFTTTDPCGSFAGNVYSACQVGDWTNSGTYLALTDDATVHVTAGAVATVTMTPGSVSLQIQQTQLFTAEARDADGNLISGATFTWTVGGGGGGRIAGDGTFTAGTVPGDYPNTVEATSAGVTGYASVTVTQRPLIAGWNLVSGPYVPPGAGSPASVWGDDFSFFVSNEYLNGGYVVTDSVKIGQGYWLGVTTPGTWDIDGGTAVSQDSFVVTLPWAGWYILGEPFNTKNVDWLSSKVSTDGGTTWVPLGSYVLNVTYHYSGGSYDDTTLLSPWFGYWTGTTQANLKLRMYVNNNLDRDSEVRVSPWSWRVPFTVTAGDMQDRLAEIGVERSARTGYDFAYDLPRPPDPPQGYVKLFFRHPRWNPVFGEEYCRDIRSPVTRGETENWDFVTRTSLPGELVTVSWPALGGVPSNVSLTLVDMDGNGQVYDMREVTEFSYVSGYAGTDRHFRVVLSVE